MTTVMLVDDQPLVRAGVSMILSAAPDIEVVAECSDGAEAIAQAEHARPDVVVMDVRMPGIDGVTATRALVEERDADHLTKVLVLTTFDDEDALLTVLRTGASGFLLKESAPADLVAAVRHVAAGNHWIDPAVAGAVIGSLESPSAGRAAPLERVAALTPREREILGLMATGLSNTEMSEQLGLSEATVKTHVGRVFMKTGSRDRAQAVILAYEAGIVRPGG